MQIHVLIELVESALKEIELNIAVQDAVTKAFASKHPGTRQAYMDLAIFFVGQLARTSGRDAAQHALFTR